MLAINSAVRVKACDCYGQVTAVGKTFLHVLILRSCGGGKPAHLERVASGVTLTFRAGDIEVVDHLPALA